MRLLRHQPRVSADGGSSAAAAAASLPAPPRRRRLDAGAGIGAGRYGGGGWGTLLRDPSDPLHGHGLYDDLRSAADVSGSLVRTGTVDVLPAGENGGEELAMCHLAAMWRYSTLNENDETGDLEPRGLGPGFYGDSSSVLLAVHHFNNGLGVVVDEVEGINERCNLRFTAEFFDTYSSLPLTIEKMTELYNRKQPDPQPCAVLGAFRSAVSTPLSILTGVYGLPQLSPVSSSPDLDNTDLHPLFSRLVPSDAGTSLLTAQYLIELGVWHVGVIFVNDAYGNAYQKAFKRIAESLGLTVASASIDFNANPSEIREAISTLKATHFRYFFGIIFGPEHYDAIMEEAYRQGIAGSLETPTFWIFGGGVQRYVQNARYKRGSPLAKVTQGAGMIQADGGIEGMPGFDRYLQAWKALDADDVEYFNTKQPEDHYMADPAYFKRMLPERESVFAYDAVIALGLAACNILANASDGSYFNGQIHFDEFVRTSFVGASGKVVIDPETTSRDPKSALYVIFNAVTNEPDEDDYVTFTVDPAVIHLSADDGWQSVRGSPFVFVDGTTNPPPPLPTYSMNMHYIGSGLRIFGILLAGVVISSSIGFAVWTMKNQHIRIIRASQPVFLVLICLGTLFMGLSIIPLSIDDEIASMKGCNIACMAVPWLYVVGFALSYSALFSKTWRINQIMTNRTVRRIKVTARDVMMPLALLMAANIIVLVAWTIVSPLEYSRTNKPGKDEFGRTLESYGSCITNGDQNIPYIATLAAINVGVLLFANFQAYLARKIRTEFSESRYIAVSMASILQAWAIGIPLMFVVVGDPRAQYLVLTCIILVGCIAILGLIMVPKFLLRHSKPSRPPRSKPSMNRQDVYESGVDYQLSQGLKRDSLHITGVNANIQHVFESEASAHMSPPIFLPKEVCSSEKQLSIKESNHGQTSNAEDSGDTSETDKQGNVPIRHLETEESVSTLGTQVSGIRIIPHEMEKDNEILKANISRLEMQREELVKDIRLLLHHATGDIIEINREILEDHLKKIS